MSATNDSELFRALVHRPPPGSAPTLVRSPAAVPEDAEAEELAIDEKDGKDASVRAANKNLTRLHIIDTAGKVRTFQYHFLDVDSTFDGGTFTLVFVGERKHWEVVVRGYGPKFWSVYDYITLHRLPYLHAGNTRGR
jgi:hypothetical protein